MSIGAPNIRPRSFQQANAKAIPPSGRSPEAIWHCAYDTQTYTDNSTTSLDFFTAVNTDKTLSNMEAAGQFPAPQVFSMYAITCDVWAAAAGVSTSATTVGNANDIYLLLMVGRPSWLFTLQNKTYGRYPLISLHSTGGPEAFVSSTVAAASQQFARNMPHGGWNYNGSITIPAQTSFQFNVIWHAAQDLTANWLIRINFFGQLDRAVK